MASKAMSLRVPEKMAEELAAIARTDGMAMSEAIRAAIAGHIISRRNNPEFQERLRRQLEEDRKILEELTSQEEVGAKEVEGAERRLS